MNVILDLSNSHLIKKNIEWCNNSESYTKCNLNQTYYQIKKLGFIMSRLMITKTVKMYMTFG